MAAKSANGLTVANNLAAEISEIVGSAQFSKHNQLASLQCLHVFTLQGMNLRAVHQNTAAGTPLLGVFRHD